MSEAIAEWIADEREQWWREHPGIRPPVLWDEPPERDLGASVEKAAPGRWRTMLSWTAIYLYLDVAGKPLYVGISVRPDQRRVEHVDSAFWDEAAAVVVRWRSSRTLALMQETALIDELNPPYNRSRRAEPSTRVEHELKLFVDGEAVRHPHEDDLRGERFPGRRRRPCWRCAPPQVLAAALGGKRPLRFNPRLSQVACGCR